MPSPKQQVPEPLGWALMPVSPIGELFGWLFALELPNSQAGFKSTGNPDQIYLISSVSVEAEENSG